MRLRWATRRVAARPLVGGLAAAALTVGGLAVALDDPPDQLRQDEVDGRTWLPVARSEGEALVLANGISGLVEAEATLDGELPSAVHFEASDRRHTLLRGRDAAVVVADGTHAATVVPLTDGARAAIVGGRLLTVGATSELRTIGPDGRLGNPRPVALSTTVRAGTDPVVDDDGTAWLLTEDELVSVAPSGAVRTRRDAPAGASGLVAVNGRAYVVTEGSVDAVAGSGELAGAGPAGVTPSVAVATDGQWAVADRASIVTADETIDAGAAVEAMAVWHGAVWWSTDGGVSALVDGETDTVADLAGPFHVFHDGGRLWFVGRSGAVAVDDRQHATVFRLTSVDLSLCVDDCSPDDAVDQNPRPDATTTTSPDRAESPPPPPPTITLPPVLPPPPSTTTTTTTTLPPTTAAPPPDAADPAPPSTDAPGSTTAPVTIPTPPMESDATSTTVVTPPVTTVLPPDPGGPGEPGPPGPPNPEPPSEPPPAPDPPRPPDPEPPPRNTDPPTPTLPPPGGGGVLLGIGGDDPLPPGSATISVGFDGTVQQCIANGGSPQGNRAEGTLQWSGAGEGSRIVSAPIGRSGSETIEVTAGTLTVSFTICGLSATVSRTVASSEPTVGAISIAGSPRVGETLTASVPFEAGVGWSLGGATWQAGACPSPPSVGGGSTSDSGSSVSFTPTAPGRYCVNVIVSFVSDGGDRRAEERSGEVQVGEASTTTEAPPTTPPPPTVPPSTEPPPPPTTPPPPTEPPPPPTEPPPPPTAAPTTAPRTTVTIPPPPPTDPPPPPPSPSTTA